jgi:uncharacterized protein YpmB
MAQLIIRIRVWLDSYPVHKIHQIFTIVIIIIIIIIIISFTQGIYTYIPETNNVPREYIIMIIITTTTTTTTTAIEFLLGGSSPYTSTDKTNNKYT